MPLAPMVALNVRAVTTVPKLGQVTIYLQTRMGPTVAKQVNVLPPVKHVT